MKYHIVSSSFVNHIRELIQTQNPHGSKSSSEISTSSKLNRMPRVAKNFKILKTLSSTTSHLTSTIFRFPDIAADISLGLRLPLIPNLCWGPSESWRVSFCRTGECLSMQVSAWKSGGTHQKSLSNKLFNLRNVGQCFISILKVNVMGTNTRAKFSASDISSRSTHLLFSSCRVRR